MFIGRDREIGRLSALFERDGASLAICRGRRRIGKSTLIQQFGRRANSFLEFQGLAPRKGSGRLDQLGAFSEQLARQTKLPALKLETWGQAFALLNSVLGEEKTVVLLDEMSWMADKDKDFAGQLKIAWDALLKKRSGLVLVACGSVSSWIDDNILNSAGFLGRLSLDIMLTELPLHHCNTFWKRKADRISGLEKLKILAVTGGVPRYLDRTSQAGYRSGIVRGCESGKPCGMGCDHGVPVREPGVEQSSSRMRGSLYRYEHRSERLSIFSAKDATPGGLPNRSYDTMPAHLVCLRDPVPQYDPKGCNQGGPGEGA